jgi:hypothetical protein
MDKWSLADGTLLIGFEYIQALLLLLILSYTRSECPSITVKIRIPRHLFFLAYLLSPDPILVKNLVGLESSVGHLITDGPEVSWVKKVGSAAEWARS